jgi:segregation and condensation protein B
MSEASIKHIIEAVLLAAGKPLTLDQLLGIFGDGEKPQRDELRQAVTELQDDYAARGVELVQVASGYRIQVRQDMEPWVSRLTEEKPARYSRALLETLALIAYRQPITRGEIEDIRGVSVSSSIVKTLQEREWVRIVGHRDVPGRPAMYGTTRQFLDYFNLKGLDDLPTLMELRDIDAINAELELSMPGEVSEMPAQQVQQVAPQADAPAEEAPRVVQVALDNSESGEIIH